MGVGILIGMQLGGPAGPDPAATDADEGTPTPVPTATSDQQGDSGTPTLPSGRTTVPTRGFDEGEIRSEVVRLVNSRRQADGLSRLVSEGQTAGRIVEMANGHSQTMARERLVRHEIDGESSTDRYRNANLYDTCQFESAAGSYIIRADTSSNSALEVLSRTVAGRPYEVDGVTEFNEEETDIARDIVDKWYDNSAYRERLSYENAEYLGVGLDITDGGQVYATGNLC
jgi:hypothetical protein